MSKDNKKTIDGELFKKMLLGGVANLQANVQEVNDLNVFPIPDGDTGENMYLTLQGGYDNLHAQPHVLSVKRRKRWCKV